MKNIYLLMLVLITACDSGGNTPSEKVITFTDVKGIAAIGKVSDGLVTAYDFNNCKKGEVLATYNMQRTNAYELSIRLDTSKRAILLELSDFIYTEESSQEEVIEKNNLLYSAFVLDADVDQVASISYWTNLSYARTRALCDEDGAGAVLAENKEFEYIQTSNALLSEMLLFDIIRVLPEQIGSEPLVFTGLDEIKYALANAGISFYTHDLDILNGGEGHHQTYTSSSFAALTFDDFVADKTLDGQGTNGQLLQGSINLTTGVYRTKIPENIYYVLAINDAALNAQKDQISPLADALNMSTAVDFFPQISAEVPVAPIDKRVTPEILPCDDCIAPPDQAVVEDCECPYGEIDGSYAYRCEMNLQFDIKDPKNRAFTVTGNILEKGIIVLEPGDLTPLVNNAQPLESGKVLFNLKYDDLFPSLGVVRFGRYISFDIVNEFGFSQNFTLEVIHQDIYKAPWTCSAKITTIDNEVVGGVSLP